MFTLFSLCLSFVFGSLPLINFQLPLSHWFQQKTPAESYDTQKTLESAHPVLKDQKFVVILFGEGCEQTIEKSLDSLFHQNYPHLRIVVIDKSGSELLKQKVMQCKATHPRKDKVTLDYHYQPCSDLESVYRILQDVPGNEIAMMIDGKDWLSHEFVFEHLNCAYANPDVWMTYSKMVSYPEFQEVTGQCFPDRFFEGSKLRNSSAMLTGLKTFYVALFHQVKLQDLLYKGEFIQDCMQEGLLFPMAEMAQKHTLFVDEIAYVNNEAIHKEESKSALYNKMEVEAYLKAMPHYSACHLQLDKNLTSHEKEYEGDVIVISQDRPLHLYSCLESLHEKVKNINEVFVLYQSSDSELERAYLTVKREFPYVRFLDLCDYPGNDFDSLFNLALAGKRYSTPYVLVMEDNTIFKDQVVLNDCIHWMERLHSERFLLSEAAEIPSSLHIHCNESIAAVQLGDAAETLPFGVSLCRKKGFERDKSLPIAGLGALKKVWKKGLTSHSVALFFGDQRSMSLKEGAQDGAKKEWAQKVIDGYKIDLSSIPFEQEQLEKGEYPLIMRSKWKGHSRD